MDLLAFFVKKILKTLRSDSGLWSFFFLGTSEVSTKISMGDVEAHGGCCLESMGQTTERWVYKGPGLGSYSKVGSLQLVGYGKGSFEILGFEGSLEKFYFEKKYSKEKVGY